MGSLAALAASDWYRVGIFAASAVAFELWSRAVTAARADQGFAVPRLLVGAALLVVIIAAPLREQDRVRDAYRTAAAIRLPDPEHASAGAALASHLAVESLSRMDLARELPAPLERTDLSDLAYRLWREGEELLQRPP